MFDGVRSLRVELGRGDDRLAIGAIYLRGGAALDLGRGADVATLTNTTVGGRMTVRSGGGASGGDDRVRLGAVHGRGDVSVFGGSRPVSVALEGVQFDADTRIDTRDGEDAVRAAQSIFGGQFAVRTGDGADTVALNTSTFAVRPSVSTGAGDDATLLGGSVFARRPVVDDGSGADTMQPDGLLMDFDFRDGANGWVGGFADMHPEQLDLLEAGPGTLPAELGVSGSGFRESGFNVTDDLFMFLKRPLGQADGVEPGRQYRLTFTIDFASNAPSLNVGGVGGSPGSVYLKAGGTTIEPQALVSNYDGYLRMNVNKGSQMNSGPAATFVSAIDNGLAYHAEVSPPYVSLRRTRDHKHVVTADPAGNLWLLVGTDSAFEARTTLYYERIRVTLTPVG